MKDITILAVGNISRGDDGIGIYTGKLLEKKGFPVIYAYETPENFLSKIKTKKVLIIDAAVIEDDYLIGSPASFPSISTHGMSLTLLEDYLKQQGISVLVAGIKPESTEHNSPLSEKAKKRAEKLVSSLCEDELPY